MIAAATPAGALDGLPVLIILCEGLLGLACVNPGAGTRRRGSKEPLTRQHPARDILELLAFVLRCLRGRKNDRHRAALVAPRKIMDERMVGVHPAKGRKNRPIEPLDESVAHADRIACLHLERTRGVLHPLIIVEDRRRHRLAIQCGRCLTDVLEDSVGLIAVPRA